MGSKAGDRAGWGMVGSVLAAAVLLIFAAVNAGHYLGRLDNPENGQDFAAYYVPAAMLRAGQADISTLAQPRRSGEALGIYPDRFTVVSPSGGAQAKASWRVPEQEAA